MAGCYVSGKITGLDPAVVESTFHKASMVVSSLGHSPVSPVTVCRNMDHSKATWKDYMMKDIDVLFDCQHIYMMRGWKDSRGARVEHAIAKELGMEIIYEEKE